MGHYISVVISRFVFHRNDAVDTSDTKEDFGVDEDGDFVVERRMSSDKLDVITIGDKILASQPPLSNTLFTNVPVIHIDISLTFFLYCIPKKFLVYKSFKTFA